MGTIAQKLGYTVDSVNDIQKALEEKGFDMSNVELSKYADLIRAIGNSGSGGSGGDFSFKDIPGITVYDTVAFKVNNTKVITNQNVNLHGTILNTNRICGKLTLHAFVSNKNTLKYEYNKNNEIELSPVIHKNLNLYYVKRNTQIVHSVTINTYVGNIYHKIAIPSRNKDKTKYYDYLPSLDNYNKLGSSYVFDEVYYPTETILTKLSSDGSANSDIYLSQATSYGGIITYDNLFNVTRRNDSALPPQFLTGSLYVIDGEQYYCPGRYESPYNNDSISYGRFLFKL